MPQNVKNLFSNLNGISEVACPDAIGKLMPQNVKKLFFNLNSISEVACPDVTGKLMPKSGGKYKKFSTKIKIVVKFLHDF